MPGGVAAARGLDSHGRLDFDILDVGAVAIRNFDDEREVHIALVPGVRLYSQRAENRQAVSLRLELEVVHDSPPLLAAARRVGEAAVIRDRDLIDAGRRKNETSPIKDRVGFRRSVELGADAERTRKTGVVGDRESVIGRD